VKLGELSVELVIVIGGCGSTRQLTVILPVYAVIPYTVSKL